MKEARLKSQVEIEALGYVLDYNPTKTAFSLKRPLRYPITVSGYQVEWFEEEYHPVVDDEYSIRREVLNRWPEIFRFKNGKARLKGWLVLPEGTRIIGWSDDGQVIKVESKQNEIWLSSDLKRKWHTIHEGNPVPDCLLTIYPDVFITR
jgi:hypothetical protein